jgi:hypothetical protein
MASPFFFVKRRTESFNPAKIIDTQMIGLSKTHIGYHLSPRLWTKSRAPNSSLNLMFNGAIIMPGSGPRTNGKQHSKQIEDYSNPL